MAGASVGQNSSGSKLDTELNLVPFIDLLSTLVLFLLLTVVWVQVAAIQASVDSRGKSTVSAIDQSKLLVHVTLNGFRLTWPSKLKDEDLPASVSNLDQLLKIISQVRESHSAMPAAVSGDDAVEYSAVIQALDTLKTAGLSFVALSTD